MCARLFHLTPEDIYKMFNMGDPRWPDRLPPPPNPNKLQQFYFAMVEVTIAQMNKENGGDEKGRPTRRQV